MSAFPKILFSSSTVAGLSLSSLIMAIPMGSIITEVAVFEIHIDKKAVATIKPKITYRTSEPMKEMILMAMRLCKFHFSIPIAIRNPPKYKKTNRCPKAAVVVESSIPPESGKSTMGKSAVAAMGTASVIHQIATQKVVAKTACPS